MHNDTFYVTYYKWPYVSGISRKNITYIVMKGSDNLWIGCGRNMKYHSFLGSFWEWWRKQRIIITELDWFGDV